MPYVLGVDIGNSFTTAALARFSQVDRHPTATPVELGRQRNAVPSVAYLDEDGQVLVGEVAEEAGSQRPDRMVREFRHRVGDTVPIVVGDQRVAPEALYAATARWVVDRADEHEGAPPDAVSLTHPVSWGDYKIARVRRALAEVGLAGATMLREPDAAALNHIQQHPEVIHGTLAVYDLGGSTFSASILGADASGGFTLLGEPGRIERLGGGDFDQLLFGRLAERIGQTFTKNDPGNPEVVEAYSVIRRECVRAKETLSIRTEASVPVVLPRVRATVRLVRPEFEAMIDGSVRETIDVFRQALESAGLTADDLAAVLLVGGCSHIPSIARQLAEEVGRPIVVDPDPAGAFSLGAALAAAGAMLAAWDAKDNAERQALGDVAQPVPRDRRSPGVRVPVAALAGARLRLSPHAARIAARSVPVAVAAVVAGMILTVVVAQGTGLSALSPGADGRQEAADAAPWFAPESLRADGVLGFPFGPEKSEPEAGADADPMPFFALPPTARATDPGRAPNRSRAGSSQQRTGEGTQAQPGPSTQQSVGTGPRPDPTPHSTPTPTPTPDPSPDPVPDPDPDPAPDPTPNPDPDPDPDPAPDPIPDPVPDPDPAPDPGPTPDPEPIPEPTPEPPAGTGA